ncbi:MAG: transcriptional regulator-like protein [Gallionellaceae bacterium]|nr:MAG: transcriptional regulator-like protein [Gallionellaceae bacterium]
MPSQNDTQLRQWAMLRRIPQQPRQITALELTGRLESEGFEVSKRTVERDLHSLSGIFPLIANDRSRPYGWSWSKDAEAFALPAMSPLQALTLELARDHLSALLPASLLGTLAPYFKCADGVLSSGDGVKKLAGWRKKVAIVPPNQPLIPPDYPDGIIEAVHSALLSGQQLEISYASREQGETKTYPAHPLGIVQRGAVTYLVATLYGYTDIRLLAVHRIRSAQVLDQPAKAPKKFDLAEYIRQGAFGFEEGGEIKLAARFTAPAAEHLRETPLSPDQRIEPDQAGWVRVEATVPGTAQLRWWLLGFGDQVEVLDPATLREEFVAISQSLHGIYHR